MLVQRLRLGIGCLAVGAIFVFGSCGGSSGGGPAAPQQQFLQPTIQFCQFDYELMGNLPQQPNSPFGGVRVLFDAPVGLYWFNCLIQTNSTTEWQIENAPLLSHGVPTEILLPIDWSANQTVNNNPDVTSVDYTHSLTTLPLQQPPENFLTASVQPYPINYLPGIQNSQVDPFPLTVPQPFQFDLPPVLPTVFEFGMHATFTNQECAECECCPAAVSNSLKTIGVSTAAGPGGMPPGGNLEISDMRTPTGFQAPSAPGAGDGGVPILWSGTKGPALMASHGVTTTDHPVPATEAARITLICDMMKAVRDGKDVEMQNGHHIAMVTAIFKITIDGKTTYSIEVAHDTSQGKAGGTIAETLSYNPTTNVLTGGVQGFFPGTNPARFTVETKP